MDKEKLPEGLDPNSIAQTLIQFLESGGKIDPTISDRLLELIHPSTNDVTNTRFNNTKALKLASKVKIGLEEITPRNENEAIVLRAARTQKLHLTKGNLEDWTEQDEIDSKWLREEFDKSNPQLMLAMHGILNDYGLQISKNDKDYLLDIFSDKEYLY